MTNTLEDHWKQWLLKRRHGGDPARLQATLDRLHPIRDRILENGEFTDGKTLLDVGCGDGLVAFGALQRTERSVVWFSDVSDSLLQHSEEIARKAGVVERCRFVHAAADDLSGVPSDSFDLVTTRSVLIFVSDKRTALVEFHRVLKAGGMISLFEPINRFPVFVPDNLIAPYYGYDIGPVRDLWEKVAALRFTDATKSMIDFDERDLVRFAEQVGFSRIRLQLELSIMPKEPEPWHLFLHTAGNPNVPTMGEAIEQALSLEEQEQLERHLKPLVEAGAGTTRSALAYLIAVKCS
ncbi:MAG TPA: class I SAM-dependent methyltransferase [Planctomycetaceae bacterium]|jgi:ubiquinone/menaquinone biosynthesis C-methylase UbiE|nr:class I SAM-dependent methyltransferase [Planctomycetaceae bacterium]